MSGFLNSIKNYCGTTQARFTREKMENHF